MKMLICLAMFTTISGIVFAIRVVRYEVDLAASQRELASLLEMPEMPEMPETPETSESRIIWSTLSSYNEKMREINPDYVGSISIEGTTINYPVVRGSDNVKYLSTSFNGTENSIGALFMDYRCVEENIKHIIIYGHHVGDTYRDRFFFGCLDAFLDEQYMAEHPVIKIIENEYFFEFEIFSARITDINDPAYYLDFNEPGSFEDFLERNGAPSDATQILTLSTCFGAGVDDRRIIVQGVLRNVSQINESQTMIATYE